MKAPLYYSYTALLILVSLLQISPTSLSAQRLPWEQTDGIPGRTVEGFAVDSANHFVFAISKTAGVFRSSNEGHSWKQSNSGLSSTTAGAIAIAPNGHLFAGIEHDGIYRSTDHGDTWQQVNTEVSTTSFTSIESNREGRLTALLSNALYESTDDGVSWQQIGSNIASQGTTAATRTNTGAFIIAVRNGGVIHQNSSGNWRPTDSVLQQTINGLVTLPDGTTLAGSNQGIFATRDEGASWKRLDSTLPEYNITGMHIENDGTITTLTAYNIYHSTDSARTWTPSLKPQSMKWWRLFQTSSNAFNGIRQSLYFGWNQSFDGGATWTVPVTGLLNGIVTSMAVAPNKDVYAVEELNGLYKTSDRGNTWVQLPVFLNNEALLDGTILITLPNGHILVGANGGFYRSTDNGSTWKKDSTIPQGASPVAATVLPDQSLVIMSVTEHNKQGEVIRNFYHSIDEGVTWQALGLDNEGTISKGTLTSDATGSVYVTHDIGDQSCLIIRYQRDGQAWHKDTLPLHALFNPNIYGDFGTLKRGDGSWLYAGTTGGFYHAKLTDTAWSKVTTGLNTLAIGPILIARDQSLYVGANSTTTYLMENGVYHSTDNGSSWTVVDGDGLHNTVITMLVTDSAGTIYAGTAGRGIFRSLSTPVSVNEPHTAQNQNLLSCTVTPNPTTSSALFRIGLPISGNINLTIYDARGELIAQPLLEQHFEAGTAYASWNASALPMGIYHYQLQTNGRFTVGSIVIVR